MINIHMCIETNGFRNSATNLVILSLKSTSSCQLTRAFFENIYTEALRNNLMVYSRTSTSCHEIFLSAWNRSLPLDFLGQILNSGQKRMSLSKVHIWLLPFFLLFYYRFIQIIEIVIDKCLYLDR